MAADIEAVPVKRGRIDGRLVVVGAPAEIGTESGRGGGDGCDGHEASRIFFMVLVSENRSATPRAGRLPWPRR